MKGVYLAALTGQTDPQSNEEVQGEFCISTLAVSANISNSYSSHNHQFKQLYVSTSYFTTLSRSARRPKVWHYDRKSNDQGQSSTKAQAFQCPCPQWREGSPWTHQERTPCSKTDTCNRDWNLQLHMFFGHNDRSWWGSNPRSQTAAKWTQFGQGETELWQMLLVKGTKYASITVSLCRLERIQNKVIKDLCCRIIPPVKKPNMTITSMPNVWAQL